VTHVWAVILGAAQGFAEFLPISSSAHLKLIPWLFSLKDPILSSAEFDIALHAGSLIALLAALWRDWLDLFLGAIGSGHQSGGRQKEYAATDVLRNPAFARRFLGFLLLTSVPGALVGVAFESRLEYLSTPVIPGANTGADVFRFAPLVLGTCLVGFGIILWAADHYVRRSEPLDKMTWVTALAIGLAQAAALIPGVSRSGSTMTAGRLMGLKREAVARYSFMAAAPIIAGAAVYGLKDVPLARLFSTDWVLGFLASAVSSVLVMRWMLSYLRRNSFAVFMWYRIAFGILVIVVFFVRG
jgi:undecaprenyl-diphosphatase